MSRSMFKFKSGTSIRGIDMADLMGAMILTLPVALLLNNFTQGLVMIGASIAWGYWVGLPVSTWFRSVVPPKWGSHAFSWLRYGYRLEVTHDRSPIPLSVRVRWKR